MNRRLLFLTTLSCVALLAACTAAGEEPAATAMLAATDSPPETTAPPVAATTEVVAEPTALPAPTVPSTSTPAPAATPTPAGPPSLEPVVGPGLVAFYGLSPSGRYLAYVEYTPEDKEENPQFPPSTLHVRDLVDGTDCAFDRALVTVNVVWRPRLAWRADDTFLLVDESGGLWGGGPCPADLIPLSLAVPNGARNIAATDTARDQFLLRGQESYFLLRLGEGSGVTPLPDEVPYGDWSSYAFSPNGNHLAFHLDSGGGIVVNVENMSVVASVDAERISGLGDMPAPIWISNGEVILRSNPEIGPVVLNTAGGTQPLRVAGAEEGRQFFVLAAVRTDAEVILLLRSYDAEFSSESMMYGLYRVAVPEDAGGFTFGGGETLGQGFTLPDTRDAALSPAGTYLLYTRTMDGSFETIVRPVAGGPESIAIRGREYASHAFAPDETLAITDGDLVRIFRGGEQAGQWELGEFALNYLEQWSADSATLIISGGYSGREEKGLFALTVP